MRKGGPFECALCPENGAEDEHTWVTNRLHMHLLMQKLIRSITLEERE